MSIRSKFGLVLFLGIASVLAVSMGVFMAVEKASLRRAQEERMDLTIRNVRNVAQEGIQMKDPLMLIDYLRFLEKENTGVSACRVYHDGRWERVAVGEGGAPGSDPRGPARVFSADGIKVEVVFSQEVLDRNLAGARDALRRSLLRMLLFVVPFVVAVSAALGYGLARRFLGIHSVLAEIGEGHLEKRADARGSDEIAALARSVNEMAGKLAELDELKKTFVASVTHELRSPLGLIETYLKNILRSPSPRPPEERQALERISNNVVRLGHFIGNLLDFSKIEKGKIEFSPRPCSLEQIALETAAFFKPKAEESGLVIETAVPPPGREIPADPDLIAQVLTNFISNAIKFTRRGGRIQVSVESRGGELRASVRDSGVGIPAADLPRVFAPFERIKNPLKATGTGLGLAISRAIIERHGGRIGVESLEGKGSCFYFILPAVAAHTPRVSSNGAHPGQPIG